MKLYDYWRSSAAYRVRIALHLKGVAYETVPVNLRQGAQRTLDFLGRNPQGLVPLLEDGDGRLSQSLAIIEFLDESIPEPPLLPRHSTIGRAEVRSLALLVACDIHPLNNARVQLHLQNRLGLGEREITAWYRHWIGEGFTALESRLKPTAGRYCYGDSVTLADLCLVPQVHTARRYGCDLNGFPTIRRIEAACLELDAFDAARPERHPDATM